MPIKAVAFDVLGTWVRIERPTRPFRKVVRQLHEAGRSDSLRSLSDVLHLV